MPIISLSLEDRFNPAVTAYLRSAVSSNVKFRTTPNGDSIEPISDPKTIRFNRYLWSEHPQVDEAVQHVVHMVHRHGLIPADIDPIKLYPTAKIIMLNLYNAHELGADYWVRFSRDKNLINTPKRYRKSGLNYEHFVMLVKTLKVLRQIQVANGFHDRSRYAKTRLSRSRQSRMKALNIVTIFNGYAILPEHLMRDPKQELIEKKYAENERGYKCLLGYDGTVSTHRMRRVLKDYNQLIKASDIRLNTIPNKPVDFSDTTVKRVFNNSSWSQGGRFYGGWWQGIKSHFRHDVLINGTPTIELDYKALHPFMLHLMRGSTLPEGFDPYSLPQHDNYEDKKKLRNLCKDFLLIALNASTERKAIKAMEEDIREDKEAGNGRYPDLSHNLRELLANIKQHNAPIQDDICTGIGLKLQYYDSRIAERVIKAMTSEAKPVLCLHDSFRCEAHHKDQLNHLMEESFKVIMKSTTHPKIEIKE